MNCLVTGATGFIGRSLCASLGEKGHAVRPVSRSGANLPDGSPTQAVDLAGEGLPPQMLEGIDTVFHLAAIAHQRAAGHRYDAVNHLAALQLARDARAAGVGQFIFLSSVKAMGAPQSAQPRGEDDGQVPTDPYGLSKWRAESDLRAEFDGSGMGVAIIRPALVYAGQAKGNLALLQRGVGMGLPRPPELGGRSMIALADLVTLLQLVAATPRSGVRTWIACDGQRYSTRRIYDLLRQRAGKGVGRAWWPDWLWRLAASAHDLLLPSTESLWDKLFATELYSNRAACSDLDWAPRLTMDAVLVGEGQP